MDSRKRDRDDSEINEAPQQEQQHQQRQLELPRRKRHRLGSLSSRTRSFNYYSPDLTAGFASSTSVESILRTPSADSADSVPPTPRPPSSSCSNSTISSSIGPSTSSTRSTSTVYYGVYEDTDPIIQRGKQLMRSCSMQSLTDNTPPKPKYHSTSAFYNLKFANKTLDYAPPKPYSSSRGASTAAAAAATGSGDGSTVTTSTASATITVGDLDGQQSTPPIDVSNTPRTSGEGLHFTATVTNIVLFSRGNRIHYKNLTSTNSNSSNHDEISQLCKIKDKQGTLKSLVGAGIEYPNIVALGTGNHHISLFDIEMKKEVSSWTSKNHTFMAWNGPTLTVGAKNGVIRSYDTRVKPSGGSGVSSSSSSTTSGLASGSSNPSSSSSFSATAGASGGGAGRITTTKSMTTRHESMITALAWNENGKLLASGEENGTVYVWDVRSRATVPLDIGDQIQRRRKMQHDGRVTTLDWCDYSPKILASGDSRGIVRVWNADASDSLNIVPPGRVQVGATIRNVFFSPHAKEILVVKGPRIVDDDNITVPTTATATASNNSESGSAVEERDNCLSSYFYPSLRHVKSAKVPYSSSSSSSNNSPNKKGYSGPTNESSGGGDGGVGKAILIFGGTKALVSVPDQGKLHLWDVYSKPPKNGGSLSRRQSSSVIR